MTQVSPCPLRLAQFAQPNVIPSFVPDWERIEAMDLPLLGRESAKVKASPSLGLALILHLHDPGPWFGSMQDRLKGVSFRSVVLTTNSAQKARQIEHALAQSDCSFSCQDLHILVCENRGRDVAPFWRSLDLIGSCDVFLKLHQKRSPQWDGFLGHNPKELPGQQWTEHCWQCLIPNTNQDVEAILKLFRVDTIGCLIPRPWPLVEEFGWNIVENLRVCNSLCRQLQLPEFSHSYPLVFPAGNMFYGLSSLFRSCRDFFSDLKLYQEEPLPGDGTTAHAIERIYSALCASRGLGVAALFPADPRIDPANTTVLSPSFFDRRYYIFPPALLHGNSLKSMSDLKLDVAEQTLLALQQESHRQLILQTKLAEEAYQPLWQIGFRRLRRRLLSL